MSDADLIARAYAAAERYLELNGEAFEAEGARFVRRRDLPDRYDGNHVYGVMASSPEEIEALLARVETEYAGHAHRAYNLGPMTPPQFIARLQLDGGYAWRDSLQMVLEGDIKASPKP